MEIVISLVIVLALVGLSFLFLDMVTVVDNVKKAIKLVIVAAALIYTLLLASGHAPALLGR